MDDLAIKRLCEQIEDAKARRERVKRLLASLEEDPESGLLTVDTKQQRLDKLNNRIEGLDREFAFLKKNVRPLSF